MLGVRRFFTNSKDTGQGNAQSDASPSPKESQLPPLSPITSIPTLPPVLPTAPLAVAPPRVTAPAPNWPPLATPVDPPNLNSAPIPTGKSPPVASPMYSNGSPATTAGLFFRKDPRTNKPIPRKSVDDDSTPFTRNITPPPPVPQPTSKTSYPASSYSSPPPNRGELPILNTSPTTPSTSSRVSGSLSPPSSSSRPRPSPTNTVKPALKPLTSAWPQPTTSSNTRDELLMSLLASQAAIDSKEYEVLSAEEVDELKKEQTLLSTRLITLRKKLTLETKVRDASQSLQELQTSDRGDGPSRLEIASRKLAMTEQELAKITARATEVQKRLLEHRAGVLSISMRALEKRMSVGSSLGSGDTDDSESNGTTMSGSPTSTTATSVTSATTSKTGKFEGAHFFAGHADAVLPLHSPVVSKAQVQALEEKLRAAEMALAASKKREAELDRDMKMANLEKTEVETTLGLELQSAEDTINALNRELDTLGDMEDKIQQLEKDLVERDKRIRDLEAATADHGEQVSSERIRELEEAQEEERVEWQRMREEMEHGEAVKVAKLTAEIEQLKAGTSAGSQEELEAARNALREVVRAHRVVVPLRATSLSVLAAAIGDHLETKNKRLEEELAAAATWQIEKERLEEDLKIAREDREALERDLEESRLDASMLESRTKPDLLTPGTASPLNGDGVFQLKAIWAMLPSVEARTARLGRSKTPTILGRKDSSGGVETATPTSIADLDVRSLKQLYDPARGGYASPVVRGEFSVPAFAERVQALLMDDRALIERLIRFAQAHELLKNNAERAQKIAQESSVALETYSKQVKTLEERNMTMTSKQMDLLDEVNQLQVGIELALKQKRELENKLAETELSLKELQNANGKLNSRALDLAAEAAEAQAAVESVKTLEAEKVALKKKLELAEEEVDAMRNAEQTQRIALLDELNSMQTENETLRSQLRVLQRK